MGLSSSKDYSIESLYNWYLLFAFPGLMKVSLLPLLLMMVSELPKVNGDQKCFPEPTSGSPPPWIVEGYASLRFFPESCIFLYFGHHLVKV